MVAEILQTDVSSPGRFLGIIRKCVVIVVWMNCCSGHVIMSENLLLSSMQDLEAALPIIEKYKDQLVAIGEVMMIQYL